LFEYLAVAIAVLVCYGIICEVLGSTPNENVLIAYSGVGLIYYSYTGGLGGVSPSSPSFYYAIEGVLVALILYLPFNKYLKQQYHFLAYLLCAGLWLGPILFLYFYAYSVLACSLLSLLLLAKKNQLGEGIMKSASALTSIKKTENDTGIKAPLYTSFFIGFLSLIILGEFN